MKGAGMARQDSNLDRVKYNQTDGASLKEKFIAHAVTKQASVVSAILAVADIPFSVYHNLRT